MVDIGTYVRRLRAQRGADSLLALVDYETKSVTDRILNIDFHVLEKGGKICRGFPNSSFGQDGTQPRRRAESNLDRG